MLITRPLDQSIARVCTYSSTLENVYQESRIYTQRQCERERESIYNIYKLWAGEMCLRDAFLVLVHKAAEYIYIIYI